MNEIVVGVDESETARRAASKAAALAAETSSPLHIVYCVVEWTDEVQVGSESFRIDSETAAEQYVRQIPLGSTPLEVTYAVRTDGPAKALCEEAARLGAQLIVVGNRRVQGMSRVLGSVAIDVVRQAPCDVLVAHTSS